MSTRILAILFVVWTGSASAAPAWNDVARPPEEAIAFALYTVQDATLKLTAQLYPLGDGVGREAELWVRPAEGGEWVRSAATTVDETLYGWPLPDTKRWLVHFRVEDWDHGRDWRYRVVAADGRARFEGLVRRDPVEKREIVVASLSCNSNAERGPRDDIVRNLRAQDPDLLFFAGDQSYDHQRHYEAWLLFGRQFGELMRDRPTVAMPDDHDVGQSNLWGEAGAKATDRSGDSGGYFSSPEYVNGVQAAQTWHLPDPVDPTPVARGIGVYFTALNVGGVDFAIIEDRKFKTGPRGVVKADGPRPDFVVDEGFDTAALDVPEARMLGDRQLAFLESWTRDWSGAEFKAVLSQTTFAQAAHRYGPGLWGSPSVDLRTRRGTRLKADLDSNGWPQSGRRRALVAMRRGFATHLCGDQHLATLVHQGVNEWGDAAVSFTSPAILNFYVRWWDPVGDAVVPVDGELEGLGDYFDGFGNRITMLAHVNPDPDRVITGEWGPRAEGYGLVRFDKETREITYEVWPRMVDVTEPGARPYAGWPVTMTQMEMYGREPAGHLPAMVVEGLEKPVFEVVHEGTGEVVYTLRAPGPTFRPHVFDASATYTVRVMGQPGPERELTGLVPSEGVSARTERVTFE